MFRNKKIRYSLIGLFIVAGFVVVTGAGSGDFKLRRNMEILMNVFRDINYFYVDEVDSDKILEKAATGIVSSLDPYTEFMPEEEVEKFEVMTTGKYGGIGALIREKGDWVYIAEPYKDSPADRAGLQIGDKIVGIDGQDAKAIGSAKVSSMLKGDPGTKVTINVEKFYTGKVEEIEIMRERISIPGVPYHGFVSDGIGYIEHSDFSENCSGDMRNAFMELKNSGNLKGLIIDYRNNGGGILQEAVKILSMFVPKGTEVVSMRGRTSESNKIFKTETDPIDLDIPIVVLTNSGTASSAEIVVGALQDLDRAVLIGQRTFGKGLVQSPRPTGFNTYIKITTAKYYMPSGRCVQAIDYAHRNEDGSVSYVPDSLVKEFHTAVGRKVYDGGGVMPDIVTLADYISRFTIIAYGKGYIEDFVDLYAKKYRDPVDPATFKLSDKDYAWFVEFMQDKDMEYMSETAAALKQLREKAQRERYIDRVDEQLDQIQNLLKDDLDGNLMLYKDQITEFIEENIVLRQHYQQGVTQYRISKDDEIEKAVEVLNSQEEYKRILESQDTVKK